MVKGRKTKFQWLEGGSRDELSHKWNTRAGGLTGKILGTYSACQATRLCIKHFPQLDGQIVDRHSLEAVACI